MDRPIKLFGLSDPITHGTGFARVKREMFSRLADNSDYDLAVMSRGWVGTRHWPRIRTYTGSSEFCQSELPMAAIDFARLTDPFILWTLQDPWQVGWISNYAGNNRLSTPVSSMFWSENRDRVSWIGHFPVDGMGPHGRPPLWFEDFLNGPDVTVFMSDFGAETMASLMKRPWRVIKHAVDTEVYKPGDKDVAKALVERLYRSSLESILKNMAENVEESERLSEERVQDEIDKKRLRLEGKFVILVVMANRERKLWPLVLEAFAALHEEVPETRLIGICGDRTADRGGYWPLTDYTRILGLEKSEDPVVWLLDTFGRMPWEEDEPMAMFNRAADISWLISAGEGFGFPQLEAHACGNPCIVGRYSASVELSVDERELIEPKGYTYAGTNMVKRPNYMVRDIVNRTRYAYENPRWRFEVGLKGAARAVKEHDWKVILPKWTSLFEEVWDGRVAKG